MEIRYERGSRFVQGHLSDEETQEKPKKNPGLLFHYYLMNVKCVWLLCRIHAICKPLLKACMQKSLG